MIPLSACFIAVSDFHAGDSADSLTTARIYGDHVHLGVFGRPIILETSGLANS